MRRFIILLLVFWTVALIYIYATTPHVDWGYELLSLLIVATIWSIGKTIEDAR